MVFRNAVIFVGQFKGSRPTVFSTLNNNLRETSTLKKVKMQKSELRFLSIPIDQNLNFQVSFCCEYTYNYALRLVFESYFLLFIIIIIIHFSNVFFFKTYFLKIFFETFFQKSYKDGGFAKKCLFLSYKPIVRVTYFLFFKCF